MEECPSPNFGPRLGNSAWPDTIILHYTGMSDGPSALARLCDPAAQVSCHYLVLEDGRVLQLVAEEHRAWHAGRSSWAGVTDMNSASIGIEIVNGGHDHGLPPYPAVQIDAVAQLCLEITARFGIKPERVLAHSDIAPSRKQDPGELFPWDRLHSAGVGHWVPPAEGFDDRELAQGDTGEAVLCLQGDLRLYGYGVAESGIFDPETETVVRAFQRHFRPARVSGRADAGTRLTLSRLLGALV